MQKRNLFVRITAIVLCAIMVLGVVTAAIYAFAAEEVAAPAQTGSPNNTWVIAAIVVAVLVLVGCAVIPKIKKK